MRYLKMLLLMTFILCFSCKGHSDQISQQEKGIIQVNSDRKIEKIDSIRFSTGGCFSGCPVYTFVLFRDNTASYEGGAFCDKKGQFKMSLQENTFGDIEDFINKNNMLTLQDKYDNGNTGMPSSILIIYIHDKPNKQIIDMQMSGNKILKCLYVKLENIIKNR